MSVVKLGRETVDYQQACFHGPLPAFAAFAGVAAAASASAAFVAVASAFAAFAWPLHSSWAAAFALAFGTVAAVHCMVVVVRLGCLFVEIHYRLVVHLLHLYQHFVVFVD